jgi:membrane-associated phospholipid phosphatase
VGQSILSGVLSRLDAEIARRTNVAVRASSRASALTAFAADNLAPVEVALMLVLALRGQHPLAARMLVAVGTVYVACEALGRLWPRPRPFERLRDVEALTPHEPGRSFPSRHVASGLVMASIGGSRLSGLMAIVAWLLGASRIAAGLHYPSDVLGGAALGVGIGYALRA